LVLLLCWITSCQKDTNNFTNNNGTYRHDLPVGASARDLLTDTLYQSLAVEVQYMPGAALQATTLNHLKATLNKYIHKPGGISISSSQVLPSDSLFTLDGIKGIEDRNRTVFTKGNQLAVYVLVTNGYYTDDSLILATAYRNTSVVLFGQCIADYDLNNTNARSVVEATALEHVFGHLLGLVDQGAPMQHDHIDPGYGHHCKNEDCLMYFGATDGYFVSQTWAYDRVIPALDSSCVADIRSIGAK
jgi:hypothetical protein